MYEIVSSQEDTGGSTATEGPLRLTSPLLRGEAVRELQEALVYYGYDVGGVDGAFGRGTDAALRQFQRDNNLDDDGILGDQTAAAMGL
ncbi:MAG: peptidoglycan-binding domain-containing protein [Hyphomicrobiaceae bacterium]